MKELRLTGTDFSVNYLDLGPQYASLTLGFSNTLATLPGVFTPTITGYIVQNKVGIDSTFSSNQIIVCLRIDYHINQENVSLLLFYVCLLTRVAGIGVAHCILFYGRRLPLWCHILRCLRLRRAPTMGYSENRVILNF